jgi:RNA polymerase sigma-70 factor (ECF subfamily)
LAKSRRDIDSVLLEAAKRGDSKAYTALFDYYYPGLLIFTKTIIKDTAEAEDLTMITFERAFAKIREYVHMCEFGTWLYRIAKHACFDFLLYTKRRPIKIGIDDLWSLEGNVRTPEQQMISAEFFVAIEIALSELPFNNLRIITLRAQGLRCIEISKELGISINTVTGTLSRIKNRLTKKLAA